ncbi:hypothetical protein VTN77DRAFT_8893 [Rasamsonia byssochlamydoides]|uniref:uncharacterized protein n=1 Tax=Rasamsonia byssochlamydoides TaxID=89139 RepID=UPI003744AAE9
MSLTSLPTYPYSGVAGLHGLAPANFRLHRALLRFQLFAELFHRPGDSSDSVSDWEERLWAQDLFWTQYDPFEVEECKRVYYLLSLCLRGILHLTPVPGLPDLLDNDPIQYRGLAQLYAFFEKTPPYTRFGVSYVRIFPRRSMYGFSIVDPRDNNEFLYYLPPAFESSYRMRYGMGDTAPRPPREKSNWGPSRSLIFERKEFFHQLTLERREKRLRGWCFRGRNDRLNDTGRG